MPTFLQVLPGVEGKLVEVSVHLGDGTAKFELLGPSKETAHEVLEGVQASLHRLGVDLRQRDLTVTLRAAQEASTNVLKLAATVALWVLLAELPLTDEDDRLFLGDRALTGMPLPPRGVVPGLGGAAAVLDRREVAPSETELRLLVVERFGDLLARLR